MRAKELPSNWNKKLDCRNERNLMFSYYELNKTCNSAAGEASRNKNKLTVLHLCDWNYPGIL